MLLTLAEMRALFETDLADAALQQLLDAAEQEIVEHAGEHEQASDVFVNPNRGVGVLFLSRRAQAIVQVRERACLNGDEVVLAADDYRLRGERELVRMPSGTNGRYAWGEEVEVDYTPIDDTATRKAVQADLVKLTAQYNAVRSHVSGDFQESFPDYQAERAAILARLQPGLAIA